MCWKVFAESRWCRRAASSLGSASLRLNTWNTFYSIFSCQKSVCLCFFSPLRAQRALTAAAARKKILQTEKRGCFTTSQQHFHVAAALRESRWNNCSWNDSAPFWGSKLLISSAGILPNEIRPPALPTSSSPIGLPYHRSKISISPSGNTWGQKGAQFPAHFKGFSFDLYLIFKICFRDLMLQRRR